MKISLKHSLGTLAAAGIVGATVLLAPGTALATASNCSKWTSDQYAVAQCTSGTGQYRIHAWCVKVNDSSQYYAVDGNWVSVPDKSRAWCPTGTYPVAKSIDKR